MAAVFQRLVAKDAANAEIHQCDRNQHGINHLVQRRPVRPEAVADGERGEHTHGDNETGEVRAAVMDDAPGGVGAEITPEGGAGGERDGWPRQGEEDAAPEGKQQAAVDAARRGVARPRRQRGHEEADEARPGAEIEEGEGVPVQREMPGVLRREQERQPRQECHPGAEAGEREKEAEGVFGVALGENVGGGHNCAVVISLPSGRPSHFNGMVLKR